MEVDEEIKRWTARRKSALVYGNHSGHGHGNWSTLNNPFEPIKFRGLSNRWKTAAGLQVRSAESARMPTSYSAFIYPIPYPIPRLRHFSGCSGPVQIIGRLEVHPEFRRRSQRIREVQCRIGCNSPLSTNQFIESRLGPANIPRERSLAHALGFEKLLQQHFARMKRIFRLSVHGLHLSVVVHYLHVVRLSTAPAENQSPLIVDADRVESLQLAFQGLKPIARRNSQVLQVRCIVQVEKLSPGESAKFIGERSG